MFNFFNNVRIGTKLTGGFLIVTIIAVIIGALAISDIRQMADADTVLFNNVAHPLGTIAVLSTHFQRARNDLRDLIRSNTAAQKADFKGKLAARDKMVDGQTLLLDKDLSDAGDRREFDRVRSNLEPYRRTQAEIIRLADDGQTAEAYALLDGENNRLRYEIQAALDAIIDMHVKEGAQISEANGKLAAQVWKTMLAVVGIGVIGSLLIGLALTVSITRPLGSAVEMLREIGKGHLSVRLNIDRRDEVGQLADIMDQFANDLQNSVVASMKKIADGELDGQLDVKDRRDEISPAINTTIESLRGLIQEARVMTQGAAEGRLEVRGDAQKFKGGYRDIVAGFNATLDAIVGPINESSEVLVQIAARDMTGRVKGAYKGDLEKMKQAINTAVENLDRNMQQVAAVADQVSSAAQQIATGGQNLSQGASEQASSLEEATSSLQEMSAMTRQNSANAKEAREVAEMAKVSAGKGVNSMSQLSEAVNKIRGSSGATAKIVKTIDEIAFQTNLLALNAAVEAARAGDAGRGFAVVAEEVRNLAMRSAEAAKNTANLIEESIKSAESGVVFNNEATRNLQEINERTAKVSEMVSEIAAASEQQDVGIQQVNKAVEQVNQIIQQNAANAEESASAAEEMSSQAAEMRTMVADFRLSAVRNATQALPRERSSDRRLPGPASQKWLRAGVTPRLVDPEVAIPLDGKDLAVLNKF